MYQANVKPRRRWLQFSLRTLLIAVTLVAGILVAWQVQAQNRPTEPTAHQLKAAQTAFAKLGASYEAFTNSRTKETVHVFLLPENTTDACSPGFHPSPMASSTSDTPSQSA